jgi:leucyl-tRNA synthetase
MVVMDGSAMSKSRGNLVRLSDELAVSGVDAIRLTMVFAGPPEDDVDWAEVSPSGSKKFLARAWRLSGEDHREPDRIDAAHGQLVGEPDKVAARLAHRGSVHHDHALVQETGERLAEVEQPCRKAPS